MNFILRIYFVGLMAFVPSQDGNELTVLLLDARNGYYASDGSPIAAYFTADGTRIPAHQPLLLARAGSCEGCSTEGWEEISDFIFPGLETSNRESSDPLADVLQGGGAWQLSASDISVIQSRSGGNEEAGLSFRSSAIPRGLNAGPILPRTVVEREDFSWVAKLGEINAAAFQVDPDVLSAQPSKGLIVARMTLNAGEVMTYRMADVGGKVVPINFRTLRTPSFEVPFTQALADGVIVEIEIEGCEVELIDRNFANGESRSMKLAPKSCDGGKVEVVVLNATASSFATQQGEKSDNASPGPGRHFEMFYELADRRPPSHLRPVPIATLPLVGPSWEELHPKDARTSDLLRALGLDRSPLDRVICPLVQFAPPPTSIQQAAEVAE